jgi:pyrroline-5-carboxylate reductase
MKIGFIGCGKMGQAILEGILSSGAHRKEDVIISAKTESTLTTIKNKYHVFVTQDNTQVAREADLLFLAIKPELHQQVIEEIRDFVKTSAIVITMAAGINIEFVEKAFNKETKIFRTMPNTPSLVREGTTAVCYNDLVIKEDCKRVENLLSSIGRVEFIPEFLMDSIPSISGSSPAYVYMMIEALADGGVKQGIPREQAYRLAASSVLGAAKMVLETMEHPGALKDQVCTPGGATIEAVAELEKTGFRSSILSAMEKCTEKVKKLSR